MRYLLFVLMAMGAYFCNSRGDLLAEDHATPKVLVIAHRTAHEKVPENSLAGIKEAITLGCDYVELDVRTTKDGQLVIMHDSSVERTTTGRGKVDEMSFDEIRALKLKGPDGEVFPGEQVPTLEESLKLMKGKLGLYLDHKAGSPAKILEVLRQQEILKHTVVYSSVETLKEYKRLEPSIWINPDHPREIELIAKLADEMHPETMDGSLHRWTKAQVDLAHEKKIQVWVDALGPIDTLEGYQYGLSINVDAIQTDHPEGLIQFLKKRGLR